MQSYGKLQYLRPYLLAAMTGFTRLASTARNLYINKPLGVNTLARTYGGLKRNGTAPAHFCKGSTGLVRRTLQCLEKMKLVEKDPNGGRKLSSQGNRDLDRIAHQVMCLIRRGRKLNSLNSK